MASYVLDTNIVSLILRGDTQVRENFEKIVNPDNIILGCPVVWYELRRGLVAKDARRQVRRFEALFATFQWQNLTFRDWSLAATLWAQRRVQGMPVSDADLLIAVFARIRNAILVTNNEKDVVGLGVVIENWTEPN
jgi:tRNA(fMet)-specific endonuclease VapC